MTIARLHPTIVAASLAAIVAGLLTGTSTTPAGAEATVPPPSHVGALVARVDATGLHTQPQTFAQAKALGIDILRTGQDVSQPPNRLNAAVDAAGYDQAVNIRAGTSPELPTTPAELDTYRTQLDHLLDQIHPALVVIENEETVDRFVDATPAQYLAMLRVAVEVAHEHGLAITNGGIPFQMVALVTWNHLRITEGTTVADRFLAKVTRGSTGNFSRYAVQLAGTPSNDDDPYRKVNDGAAGAWRDAEALFAAYGTDADDVPLDYVNFHWYATDADGFDATSSYNDLDVLRQAVDALQAITGRTLVNNEVGQWGRSAGAPAGILDVLVHEEHLPFVLWYDGDGDPADSLHDFPPDSTAMSTLRPAGVAFATWLIDHAEEVAGDVAERRIADVTTTYRDLLGRAPDHGGRNHWAVALGQPGGQARFARTLVGSAEHDRRSVDDAYLLLLGRAPDAAGEAYWTRKLATLDPEDLEVSLIGANEYYRAAGSTGRGFVDHVFHDVLNRDPDPAGLAYWSARAATPAQRRAMAATVVRSSERMRTRIEAEYRRLLGRSADSGGMAHWLRALRQGSIDDLDVALASSAEYQRRAQAGA